MRTAARRRRRVSWEDLLPRLERMAFRVGLRGVHRRAGVALGSVYNHLNRVRRPYKRTQRDYLRAVEEWEANEAP